MLLRGPEYTGAKHSELAAEQQHLSYHMTRASGCSEALGASLPRRPSRAHRHSHLNHVHAPVKMPVSSNRGDLGSSDAPLHLSPADSTLRRRGKSQDDPYPPPRYDGLGVKSYIRLTVSRLPWKERKIDMGALQRNGCSRRQHSRRRVAEGDRYDTCVCMFEHPL